VTHEDRPNAEADNGPEHDHNLPDAAAVPLFATPQEAAFFQLYGGDYADPRSGEGPLLPQ
jgi:hypothetical protein